jgi:alpha-mannosidase
VELNGIPITDGWGKDVTVNWNFQGFNASNTFYTDSNALEMQERILNKRPDFEYESDQNVSSNYYPVGSAIAIRDFGPNGEVRKQALVMNDKT